MYVPMLGAEDLEESGQRSKQQVDDDICDRIAQQEPLTAACASNTLDQWSEQPSRLSNAIGALREIRGARLFSHRCCDCAVVAVLGLRVDERGDCGVPASPPASVLRLNIFFVFLRRGIVCQC